MFENLLLLTHIVVSVFLVIIILLQRSDGGLGSLGGGGGSGALMSGASAGNGLTKATKYLAILFIGTSMLLSMEYAGSAKSTSVVDAAVVGEIAKADDGAPIVPQALPATAPTPAMLEPTAPVMPAKAIPTTQENATE